MLIRESFYEEIEVFGQPNTVHTETARGRCSGIGISALIWGQHSTDLSVVIQIWRYGCGTDEAAEGT